MRVEVIRIIADWLENATYGVNGMLLQVPRDAGDAKPANVVIRDETRDSWVARGVAPRLVSASEVIVAVSSFQEGSIEGLDTLTGYTWQPGELPVVIRVIRQDVDSAVANLDSGITTRAVRWSLNLLRRHQNTASRIRNKVQLHEFTMTEIPVHAALEDVVVSGAVLLRCNAIDAVIDHS